MDNIVSSSRYIAIYIDAMVIINGTTRISVIVNDMIAIIIVTSKVKYIHHLSHGSEIELHMLLLSMSDIQ